MNDDKVLVSRDLIRRLIFSGALLTEDELEEEVCALMTAPAQPSDGALTNEGAEPVAWIIGGGRTWEDKVFTSEHAAPRTCTCQSGDGSLRWTCPVHPPESEDAQIAAGRWHEGAPSNPWDSEQFLAQMRDGLIYVLRPLPKNHTYDFTTANATYVLRKDISYWAQLSGSNYIPPEPVHPPEVRVVLPERMYSLLPGADYWNACLDRVKELNS